MDEINNDAGAEEIVDPIDDGDAGGEETIETPDFGGFSTLGELIADNQAKAKAVEDFTSLKGRLGNELGQTREELAKMRGSYETLQEHLKSSAKPQVTKDDIQRQLDDGEITTGQAISMMQDLVKRDTLSETQKMFQEFQASNESKSYADRFIRENPGYVEAFNSGALAKYIQAGLSGEQAWDRHQLEQSRSESEKLKSELKTLTEKAKNAGIQLGVKLEQGKDGAGKVLDGQSGASFGAAGKDKPIPQTVGERNTAALQVLNRLRSSP